VALTGTLLAAWELYVRLGPIDPLILPAPSAVAASLISDRGLLWSNLTVTAGEIVPGIVVAVVLAIGLAAAIHLSPLLRRAAYPLLVASQAVPLVLFAPLLVAWLGFGLVPKLVIIALVSFFPILVATLDGLASVEPDMLKLMSTLGASRWQTIVGVVAPGQRRLLPDRRLLRRVVRLERRARPDRRAGHPPAGHGAGGRRRQPPGRPRSGPLPRPYRGRAPADPMGRPPVSAPRPLLASLFAAAAVQAGCGEKRETRTLPATPTPVTVALDGAATAPLAPLYAAIADGDFTRGGLAVSVATRPGAALVSLASGAADFAVASEPDLLRARDRGAALVAVGAIVQSPLDAIVSIAPHPVTKVTQLDGRTVAAPVTPLAAAELDTILRQAGVASSGVHRRDAGADPPRLLVRHAADAILGDWSFDAVRLGLSHHQPQAIKVEAAGVPTYDRLVLVVRQAEARTRGPVLRTFLQALSAGVRTTVATPARAVDRLVAANPGLSRPLELASLQASLPVLDPTPTGSPYGFVDPRVWQRFGRWMLQAGLLTRPDDAARAITDEFLPGQGE
jgi:ABC-type nitrate/sulfonate/bicarbonate transport system substrate-binding protein